MYFYRTAGNTRHSLAIKTALRLVHSHNVSVTYGNLVEYSAALDGIKGGHRSLFRIHISHLLALLCEEITGLLIGVSFKVAVHISARDRLIKIDLITVEVGAVNTGKFCHLFAICV